MRLDMDGNLWIAAGINRARREGETTENPAGVYVISPAGKLLGCIPVPEDLITNLAFGGQDKKTLYITAGKSLFKIQTKVAGWSVYPK
jgi:gluconolactonase